jgi:hypothetical protein
MEIRTESKDGEVHKGIDQARTEIERRLKLQPKEWLKALCKSPGEFVDIEQQVHLAFKQMADEMVAGLLAQATKPPEFTESSKKKVMANAKVKLRSGETRPLLLRLLGGMIIYATTLYCSPAKRNKDKDTGKSKGRGREGSGLYPELGVLGIQEGKTPALIREVGREVALMPYELARQGLAARGLDVDIKELYAIAKYAGEAALAYRRRELELFRLGKLPAADGKGKRLGAMIDGGRTKIRTNTCKQIGRGQAKKQKRRFQTDWREVKQIIIFEMDEWGRMIPGTLAFLDGTFGGPNEIMELLAMRLHQMGASQAEVVAFRTDGAHWMWGRLDWVIQKLGLKPEQVSKGLDFCHGVHHVSLALAGILSDKKPREAKYKELRDRLKDGGWDGVVAELQRLAEEAKVATDSSVWTAIAYLARHGDEGHLDYAAYKREGLPLGSGAIESAIRRVINLRLKGNGIFWEEENAEAMLVLRGLVLSGRWNESFAKISESMSYDRRLDWRWKSPDMPTELKTGVEIKPAQAQPSTEKASCAAAA